MGVDADIDGEDEIDGVGQKGEIEVEEGGEAGADKHEAFVDAVDGVVDVVAVDGALAVEDPREGAVEGIAVPVDYKTEGAEPEPLDVVVGEDESDGYDEGSEGAHNGEHVGGYPAGLTLGKPHKYFLFSGVDERGLYS